MRTVCLTHGGREMQITPEQLKKDINWAALNCIEEPATEEQVKTGDPATWKRIQVPVARVLGHSYEQRLKDPRTDPGWFATWEILPEDQRKLTRLERIFRGVFEGVKGGA